MNDIGQINFETQSLGVIIRDIATYPDVKNIVEIGAWNGLGSTRCVLEGLKGKYIDTYNFKSFECSPEMYTLAVKNNKDKLNPSFDLIFGKIVDESSIDSWFDKSTLSPDQKGWLLQDYNWMKDVPNVSYKLPTFIDFLILDGGEFSTYMEWQLLKSRIRYCVLDDTTQLKCRKIREEVLSQSSVFRIINDNQQERNGYLVFEKI